MLKEKIKQDSVQALKAGNQFETGTLRMLLAAILVKEKDKQYLAYRQAGKTGKPELSEEEVIETITGEIKKRKDAVVLYEKGNRPELAERENKEIEILKKYLPEQLTEEELKKIVEESIRKTGAKEIKDMGKVMADLNPKIKGRADGGQASSIVKQFLSK